MLPTLTKREKNGFTAFRRQMNRLFTDFLPDWSEGYPMEGVEVPPLDLAETESSYIVKTELPGVDVKDIEVSVTGETLTIKAEKKEEKEEKGKTWHRVERSHGLCERVVQLPAAVKADQILAEQKDGVLTVTLPKSPEAVSKKVVVKPAR